MTLPPYFEDLREQKFNERISIRSESSYRQGYDAAFADLLPEIEALRLVLVKYNSQDYAGYRCGDIGRAAEALANLDARFGGGGAE